MGYTNLFLIKFFGLILAKVRHHTQPYKKCPLGLQFELKLVWFPLQNQYKISARNPIKTNRFKICIRETDVGLGLFVCSCKHFKRTNYISDIENYKMYPWRIKQTTGSPKSSKLSLLTQVFCGESVAYNSTLRSTGNPL